MSGEMFISLPFGVPDMFLGYSFFVGDCFFLGLYSLGIPVLFGVALLPLSHKRNETAYNTRSEDLTLLPTICWTCGILFYCQPCMPLLPFSIMYIFFRREALLSRALACNSFIWGAGVLWCPTVPFIKALEWEHRRDSTNEASSKEVKGENA